MKKFTFLIIIFLFLQQYVNAQNNNLRYEILLNKGMLKDSVLNGSLSGCLDISPQHFVTLSNGELMYLLGWGGATPVGNRSKQNISGFAYTSDGLLLTIQDKELSYINTDGNWERLIELPSSNMAIAQGKDVIYLYDKDLKLVKYNAYALAKAGRYKHLFVSPVPIKGICEVNDSIYVAIENGIYSYSPQYNKLSLVFALEKEMTISSLSADPVNEILFFSTETAIYAQRKDTLILLTKDFPGSIVKYFGNGLIIFNPESKDILRIVNVESSIEF